MSWYHARPKSFDQWWQFGAPHIGLFGHVEDFPVVTATVRRLRRGRVDDEHALLDGRDVPDSPR